MSQRGCWHDHCRCPGHSDRDSTEYPDPTGQKQPTREEIGEAISELSNATGNVLRSIDTAAYSKPVFFSEKDEDLFPCTIVFRRVAILNSAWYESSDSARKKTAKKQAASAIHPRACSWARRVSGIFQRVHPHAFGEC